MSEAWQDDDFTADELAFDEELQERLRMALDAAGPSEEAEERMLANLLAAQEARVADASDADAGAAGVVEPIELPQVTVIEGGKRGRKAPRGRRFALAAAAAFAAVALGAGVIGFMTSQKNEAMLQAYDASAVSATSATSDSGADFDAYESEGAAESALPPNLSAEAVGGAAPEEKLMADEGASGGAIEGDAAEPEELLTMGGAFDASGDPSYELAVTYPEVRLATGEVLLMEEHDGGPIIIEEKWVEQLVGEAEAFTEDGSDSVSCWVYRLPVSDDGLYVVRYVENGSCFAIRVAE